MRKINLLFIIVLSAFCTSLLGQEKNHSNDSIRQEYIREFPDFFYLKFLTVSRLLNLELTNRLDNNVTLEFAPNLISYTGFGGLIMGVGFEVSFKSGQSNPQNEERFGTTQVFDFQANLYGRKFGLDFAFQNYEGFYLDNPGIYDPEWEPGDVHPQRSDLVVKNRNLAFIKVFNDNKYSFRSSYNQAEQQLKSAGSFLMTGFMNVGSLSADSSLIPDSARHLFGINSDIRSANSTTFGVLPGYSHTFVFLNFYLNLTLSIGPALQWRTFELEEFSKRNIGLQGASATRIAIGYNNNRFFTGFTFVFQNTNSTIENVQIRSTSGNIKFSLGYRFGEFGFLKKNITDFVPIPWLHSPETEN